MPLVPGLYAGISRKRVVRRAGSVAGSGAGPVRGRGGPGVPEAGARRVRWCGPRGGGAAAAVVVPVPAVVVRGSLADNERVLEMTREEFEELVAQALDRIPPELTRLMDNVAVFVEDEPPADDPELLGLYEGTPLTERGEWYAGVLPDRITIYRGPTLRMVARENGGRELAVEEIEITVVHEIAHHFGIDDARLHELGWG